MRVELNPSFRCLAASVDGTRVSAGSGGGTLVAWDIPSEREVGAWNLGGQGIAAIVQPIDRRWIAADPQGTLWIAEEPGLARSLSADPVHAMTLSADAKQLLAVGREVLLRDAQTLDVLHVGPRLSVPPRAVAASPTGTTFAVAERSLILWRPEGNDVERHDLSCAFVDFFDHATLVMADAEWVDVYALNGWTRLHAMRCYDGMIRCGWLDRAAQIAYVGTDRGVIVPYHLSTGQPGTPLPLFPSPILALVPTRNGLAALQQHGVRIVSRVPLKPRAALERHSESSLEIGASGEWIVSSDSHSIRVWDPSTGLQRAGYVRSGPPLNIVSSSVSPDGRRMAIASYGSSIVRWIDADSGEDAELDVGTMVFQLRLAPTGKILAVLSTYDTLALFTLSDRKQTVIPGQFRSFALSHPTGLVAGITVDSLLKIYDYVGRNTLFTQRQGQEVAALVFSPDESHVGILDYSGAVRTIDLRTGRETSRAPCSTPVDQTRMAIGDDGRLIAMAAPWGDIQLWYDGQRLAEFKTDRDVRHLAIAEGKLRAVGVESIGPEQHPLIVADQLTFNVAYDALFTYKLAGP